MLFSSMLAYFAYLWCHMIILNLNDDCFCFFTNVIFFKELYLKKNRIIAYLHLHLYGVCMKQKDKKWLHFHEFPSMWKLEYFVFPTLLWDRQPGSKIICAKDFTHIWCEHGMAVLCVYVCMYYTYIPSGKSVAPPPPQRPLHPGTAAADGPPQCSPQRTGLNQKHQQSAF